MATFTVTVQTPETQIEPWEHARIFFHVDVELAEGEELAQKYLLTVASGSDRMLTKGKTEFVIPGGAFEDRVVDVTSDFEIIEMTSAWAEPWQDGMPYPTKTIWGADTAITEIATQGAVPSKDPADPPERAFFLFEVYALESEAGKGTAYVPVSPD